MQSCLKYFLSLNNTQVKMVNYNCMVIRSASLNRTMCFDCLCVAYGAKLFAPIIVLFFVATESLLNVDCASV